MIFNDFKIKEVTPEDSFLGELRETVDHINQSLEQLVGEIQAWGNDDNQRNTETLAEVSEWASEIYARYTKLILDIDEEWKRRGEPRSIRQQNILKAHYDALDDEHDYNARY